MVDHRGHIREWRELCVPETGFVLSFAIWKADRRFSVDLCAWEEFDTNRMWQMDKDRGELFAVYSASFRGTKGKAAPFRHNNES